MTECAIILKSSSIRKGAFQRVRGVVRCVDVETALGVEYRLKLVGLITPDIVEMELL